MFFVQYVPNEVDVIPISVHFPVLWFLWFFLHLKMKKIESSPLEVPSCENLSSKNETCVTFLLEIRLAPT